MNHCQLKDLCVQSITFVYFDFITEDNSEYEMSTQRIMM